MFNAELEKNSVGADTNLLVTNWSLCY